MWAKNTKDCYFISALSLRQLFSQRRISRRSLCCRWQAALKKSGAALSTASPLQKFTIRGQPVLVKRDDMILSEAGLNGNKRRKFNCLDSHFMKDIDTVVSWGGTQSNSMGAIAKVAQHYNVPFVYYTRKAPTWLKKSPTGNYQEAVTRNTDFRELSNDDYQSLLKDGVCFVADKFGDREGSWIDSRSTLFSRTGRQTLIIPQGGAWPLAEKGVRKLAIELRDQLAEYVVRGLTPNVVVASGTGTTALFLARHLQDFARVVAIPIVGDASYLLDQMLMLDRKSGDCRVLPDILRAGPKRIFGHPHQSLLKVYEELASYGLCVDLVYATAAWEKLWSGIDVGDIECGAECPLVYYHCGGLKGNASMRKRYERRVNS